MDEHGKPVVKRVASGGRAMMFIVESGALYLVTQLIFVILVATRNSAEGILSLAGTQIYVRSCTFQFAVNLIWMYAVGDRIHFDYNPCGAGYIVGADHVSSSHGDSH